MNDLTEQQLMGTLGELIKEGKVRSFVKQDGDPLNPDDWLYALVEDNS